MDKKDKDSVLDDYEKLESDIYRVKASEIIRKHGIDLRSIL
jgi:hypothetical protein